ncbi:hypothetical protein BRW64_18940 [Mycolicibacterium diernhoferi]|uniref:PPM-type phosphatase domain-containing protein n=1 Tax=Mycolicibacterium diernhoferi TaxID=1801 RepID=A0A1Q4H9I2_9MYCO|nr:hypothetical protein BRW64_18940 [Mycolicibacterium diernhoferi]OPE56096.1 hypothetical protein BV510_01590 [Mycolicibacterium diernhoferi]
MCGASVTGDMHRRRGLDCDDAYGYGVAGGLVVAAVADGAGSVSGTSAWGSYTACQSVVRNALHSQFRRDFATDPGGHRAQMRWLFERALQHVRRRADAMQLELPMLATTLSVVVADRRGAVLGQIGDGVIAVETESGISTRLIETKDEYANTTWFLQSDRAFDVSFRSETQPGVSAFALSTDGMSYKITDITTGGAYEPFFRGSWEHVRAGTSSAHFAALLRGITDDQTGDDKTMVLSALRWEDDDFHPSARPVRTTIVGSPPPATVRARHPQVGGHV